MRAEGACVEIRVFVKEFPRGKIVCRLDTKNLEEFDKLCMTNCGVVLEYLEYLTVGSKEVFNKLMKFRAVSSKTSLECHSDELFFFTELFKFCLCALTNSHLNVAKLNIFPVRWG
jgi:hypothetical protein